MTTSESEATIRPEAKCIIIATGTAQCVLELNDGEAYEAEPTKPGNLRDAYLERMRSAARMNREEHGRVTRFRIIEPNGMAREYILSGALPSEVPELVASGMRHRGPTEAECKAAVERALRLACPVEGCGAGPMALCGPPTMHGPRYDAANPPAAAWAATICGDTDDEDPDEDQSDEEPRPKPKRARSKVAAQANSGARPIVVKAKVRIEERLVEITGKAGPGVSSGAQFGSLGTAPEGVAPEAYAWGSLYDTVAWLQRDRDVHLEVTGLGEVRRRHFPLPATEEEKTAFLAACPVCGAVVREACEGGLHAERLEQGRRAMWDLTPEPEELMQPAATPYGLPVGAKIEVEVRDSLPKGQTRLTAWLQNAQK